jgi:hypothetical protein
MELRDSSMMAFRRGEAPNVKTTYDKMSDLELIEISPDQGAPPTDAENGVMIQWVPPRQTGSREVRRLALQLAAVEGISTNNSRRAA